MTLQLDAVTTWPDPTARTNPVYLGGTCTEHIRRWAENMALPLPSPSEPDPVTWTIAEWDRDVVLPHTAAVKEWASEVLRYKRHLHGHLPNEGALVDERWGWRVGEHVRVIPDAVSYAGFEGYLTGDVSGGSVLVALTGPDHAVADGHDGQGNPGAVMWRQYHADDRFWWVTGSALVATGTESEPAGGALGRRVADLERELAQAREHHQADLDFIGAKAVERAEGGHWEEGTEWCSDYEGYVRALRRHLHGTVSAVWDRDSDGWWQRTETFSVTLTRRWVRRENWSQGRADDLDEDTEMYDEDRLRSMIFDYTDGSVVEVRVEERGTDNVTYGTD